MSFDLSNLLTRAAALTDDSLREKMECEIDESMIKAAAEVRAKYQQAYGSREWNEDKKKTALKKVLNSLCK